jgi:predicted metal-dependent phosphoesterase TrpH
LWALTDHDEIGGQHRALRRGAKRRACATSPGTEISVTFAGKTVHIVGLGFDPDDAALQQGLAATRGGRGRARPGDVRRQLAKVGIHGAYEGALKYVGNPELISRTHFARFLVETGVCRDTSTRCFANTSPKASPAMCRTAGPAGRRGADGSPAAAAWP